MIPRLASPVHLETQERVMKQCLLGTNRGHQDPAGDALLTQNLLEKPEMAFLFRGPRRSKDGGMLPAERS